MERLSYTAHLSNGDHAINSKSKLSGVAKHNLRKYRSEEYDKENIVILCGTDKLVQDVKKIYKEQFDEAVQKYNANQTRDDRKIANYYEKVANDKKKDKQESASTISEEVQEFVNLTITEHMGKAYSEWKLKQDKEPVSEIDKKYQKLLETLSQEQEEVITEYCNAIFSSGAETEEFFYRLGLKDGLNLKNTVKSVLEMIS